MIVLPSLIQQCVPNIAQAYMLKKSMLAIVQVESKGNVLALGLNKGYKLQFQPQSKVQAQKWVEYLDKHNYNFDIGLAQVNIKNVHKYGYRAIDLLDPCTNLKLGSLILSKNYINALPGSKSSDEAWQKAISAYNTGNFRRGFTNGYVSRVYASTSKPLLALNGNSSDIPSIIDSSSKKDRVKINETAISGTTSFLANPYRSRSLLYIQQKKPIPNEINTIKVAYNAPAA